MKGRTGIRSQEDEGGAEARGAREELKLWTNNGQTDFRANYKASLTIVIHKRIETPEVSG